MYGNYLLSHNINPESGDNVPYYQQVYTSAHNKAFENGKPILHPTRDIQKDEVVPPEQLHELKNRNPIMPGEPSKNLKRNVVQLDLLQEPCFASKHSTPAPSELVTSEGGSRNQTPKFQKNAQRAFFKEETKSGSQIGVKPSTGKQPTAGSKRPSVLNAKDSRVKDISDSRRQSQMKTMASTGKSQKRKFKEVNPHKPRSESNERPLMPIPVGNPFDEFYPKNRDHYEDQYEYDENEDPNQSQEVRSDSLNMI